DKPFFKKMTIIKELFKISEIATFLGVTPTTLRYYEQYGFIKPAKVDIDSGYRYYNIKNIGEITHIIDLRRLGLSMRQIQKYFNEGFDTKSFIEELKRKREALDRQIVINELRFADENAYTVDFINTKPTYCLIKESNAKNIGDIEEQFATFLINCLRKGYSLDENFMTFIEFDSVIPKFKNIPIKMFIIVRKPSVETSVFPAIYGIHTFHKGSYKRIGDAYSALLQFAAKNNLKLKGTAIENYFRSTYAVDDERSMLTDVILSLEK
ncbi:MAG: MerR family transcriptional regulator, partial [Bacilli bacterium]